MSRYSVCGFAVGAALVGASIAEAFAAGAGAASAVPDFSSGNMAWARQEIDFQPVPGASAGPVRSDPQHPYRVRDVDAQGRDLNMTQRVADLTNPILKDWVKDSLAKRNAMALRNETPPIAMSTCWPAGVPNILMFLEPMYFLQTPKEVTIVYQRDHWIRHVYMNVPHSKTVKPSWYGESVGHYENGDTLVIDTVGLSDKSFIDQYGTPHTDKEHVIERIKLAGDGKSLEVKFTVEDPGAFNMAWNAMVHFRRVKSALIESICAENNFDYFHGESFPIPQATKVEF
jgi:hypothetical protein